MMMTSYHGGDRRPIASRDRKVFQRMAHGLAVRGVSANVISVTGMVCGMIAGAALIATSHLTPAWIFWIAAACCMQLRLLANMFDGMVAIERGTASPVGELYNEVPDRFADVAILVGAGYALGGDSTLGWAAACVAVVVAYVRAAGVVAGAPNVFCGPMAKPHRMFVMTVAALYAGLAPAAWQPVRDGHGVVSFALAVVIILGVITIVRRLNRMSRALRQDHS
ncbi:MAG: CDP-alcohol phosphatidyltransferase family protein [Phycisphaerales bacterium]|nr:CDP-alcohol phosphatidyltransferase family protein [Phycisphaerales bacterium]